ncbi:(2Fe-2S)-binding protein [Nocardioides sp. MH1]|uniref:(2Fe-2S)-binding protein n=1 Tax=Nocardioides sp. MH1 TaxID=3242490 RepID=UPI0035206FE0
MSSRSVDPAGDPVLPGPSSPVTLTFEGRSLEGVRGQTVAVVLLAHGTRSWRTSAVAREPRGAFCGIGVCFECVVTVDGERDVRACLRRVEGGEHVERQED